MFFRDRTAVYFLKYLEENKVTNGKDLGEVLKSQEGRILFSKFFSAFFFTLRVRENEWPKLGYAENIRTHIKQVILSDFAIDITFCK